MSNKNYKYIIDVDTGIDDALAIILASKTLREKVIGITTCGGNVRLEDATSNTLKVLDLARWDIPVYAGASKSIENSEFVHAYDYHGTNGICDVQIETNRKPENLAADDFIIETAKKKELAFVCLATPTNLASALKKNKEIARNIKVVYIMGGALNVPGNQTEYAEYNFFQDPQAVRIVFENIKDVRIIPLDVTNQCIISDKEAALIRVVTPTDKFIKEAITNWYRFFGYPKKRQFELYDPLVVSATDNKNLLSFSDVKIGISVDGIKEGEIFLNGKYSVKIAQKVQTNDFKNYLLNNLDIVTGNDVS